MAGETIITIVGNLTADPELRFTQNGLAVANLTIASTPRQFDRQANEWKEGDALFMRCSVWKEFAEHVSGSLTKGTRVIAQGRLKQRSYQDREGQTRTSIELEIDAIGPDLQWATAQVTKAGSNRNQGQRTEQFRQQQNGGQQNQMRPGTDQAWSPNQGHPQDGQISGQQSNDVWSTPGTYDDETPF